jgi:hypothetical protein
LPTHCVLPAALLSLLTTTIAIKLSDACALTHFNQFRSMPPCPSPMPRRSPSKLLRRPVARLSSQLLRRLVARLPSQLLRRLVARLSSQLLRRLVARLHPAKCCAAKSLACPAKCCAA